MSSVPDLLDYDSDVLIDKFNKYLFETRDKKIVMVSEDNELITFDYTHRWKEKYQKMVYSKFMTLVDYYSTFSGLNVIMGTLTVDPSSKTMLQAMQEIKSNFHLFMNDLRSRYKHRTGNTLFNYIAVPEPQKSGMVHLHYLIFGAVPSDFVDDYTFVTRYNKKTDSYKQVGISPGLDALWKSYGFGYINQFELVRYDKHKIKQVASYLLKYISKAHHNTLFSAYLWFTGVRSYSASRFISSIMKTVHKRKKDPKHWDYLGCFDGWFIAEHGLKTALSALTAIPDSVSADWVVLTDDG